MLNCIGCHKAGWFRFQTRQSRGHPSNFRKATAKDQEVLQGIFRKSSSEAQSAREEESRKERSWRQQLERQGSSRSIRVANPQGSRRLGLTKRAERWSQCIRGWWRRANRQTKKRHQRWSRRPKWTCIAYEATKVIDSTATVSTSSSRRPGRWTTTVGSFSITSKHWGCTIGILFIRFLLLYHHCLLILMNILVLGWASAFFTMWYPGSFLTS